MPLFYAFDPDSSLFPFEAPPLPLILYQRDDCHLCDLALEVLAVARVPDFESVFIDDDEALEERYGARVPVLRNSGTGVELDWPFDAAAVSGCMSEAAAPSG